MKTGKKKIVIAVVIVLLIIAGIIAFLLYRRGIRATTMRILRLEGTVSMQENGVLKTIKENLRLKSGNTLDTSTESLVSIGLDDAKIVTLDELSRAEFNQQGKYLNLDLTKGSLFFEVDKPLADDESFEIATSTMVVGIRGTSGWVSVDGENESLIISDGHVHVIGTNPVTGAVKEVDVSAGQRLVVYLYNDRTVDSIMFELEDITERDLPKFVINILRNKISLLDRVVAATGWDREYILGVGDEDSEPDDPNATTVADVDPVEPEPEPSVEPVVPDDPEPADVGGNNGNDQPADTHTGGNNNNNQNNTNNHNNNNNTNNNNNGNNNGNNATADTIGNLTTAPVTQSEMQRQIAAAKAQVVSENTNGTYTLADGTVFDPDYYQNRYPDVTAQYGNDSDALLAHYVANGQAEGRYASNDEEQAAELAEDIARLEAQRIADEAAQQNQNNNQNQNTNTNQNTNQNQQQQQQQNQIQNQNTTVTASHGVLSNGTVNISGGEATYDSTNNSITITNATQGNVSVPATIYDADTNQTYNISLSNVQVSPATTVANLDISSLNASVADTIQYAARNNASVSKVTNNNYSVTSMNSWNEVTVSPASGSAATVISMISNLTATGGTSDPNQVEYGGWRFAIDPTGASNYVVATDLSNPAAGGQMINLNTTTGVFSFVNGLNQNSHTITDTGIN